MSENKKDTIKYLTEFLNEIKEREIMKSKHEIITGFLKDKKNNAFFCMCVNYFSLFFTFIFLKHGVKGVKKNFVKLLDSTVIEKYVGKDIYEDFCLEIQGMAIAISFEAIFKIKRKRGLVQALEEMYKNVKPIEEIQFEESGKENEK